MEDIILNYAKKIASSKNIQKTIEELAGLYEKNGMYNLLAPCLIKLSNYQNDASLFEKIADIYQFKLRNFDDALLFYNRYLQKTNLNFYKKYVSAMKYKGHKDIDIVFDLSEDNYNLRNLCDRFDLLISLLSSTF